MSYFLTEHYMGLALGLTRTRVFPPLPCLTGLRCASAICHLLVPLGWGWRWVQINVGENHSGPCVFVLTGALELILGLLGWIRG